MQRICKILLQRKSILWFINQEHMTNVPFLARCVRKTSLGKASTETTWEGNSQKFHICTSCPYETPYKRYLNKHVKTHDKEKVNGAPKFCPECGKSFPAKRNLTKHLKIHQSLFSFNMSGYFVVVGDLLVVPLGPFPLDTLINFWLLLDPLPASSLSNYSLPIDFVYNNLDQAFCFYSKAWINDTERFILLFMNWQITRSPWL